MKKLKLDDLNRTDVASFKKQPKLPIVVVLDNVRSMHNVGSIFRTSDAFSIEEILLCGITAQPPHREIEKAALGATKSVDWRHFTSTKEAVEFLKANNYRILAIEQASGSTMLNLFEPQEDGKFALIFGNEVEGVSDEVMNIVDDCVEIPQFGTKHSFNISISAGIVLWDVVSKLMLRAK
ncbi:23S rRNA (guanosine2251-2'-O)-methyltransferase [Pedobacter sp. UYP30]|uniref:RNA methyltransferase n=1 Tax=Pedobacter sp. UYP30 TaxID=1756400 RepID=UPI003396738A